MAVAVARLDRWLHVAAFFAAFVYCSSLRADEAAEKEPPFAKDIAAFEKADKDKPPTPGQVLFVGSSSIRLWNLKESFPEFDALNRGFGGSQMADVNRYFDRIVTPYKPRTIVLYAGDNDIAAGKSPEQVFADFKTFAEQVDKKLPGTPVLYISIKPSVARWKLIDKGRTANKLIRDYATDQKSVKFVDIEPTILGSDGKPDPAMLRDDGLHLNDAGYVRWTSVLKPLLK